MMSQFLESLRMLAWTAMWTGGGWLLAASLFRLRRAETAMVGFGLGMVLQIWLANLCAQALEPPLAFWLAPLIVLAAGIVAAATYRTELRSAASLGQWVLLGGLVLLFNGIGRGLGVFDDYQNLPTVSLMATGDIPPHFALDPSLQFGYHYLLLLFASELMRVGDLLPWTALDLARAIMLGTPLVLAGLWAYRLARSRVAAFLGVCVVALAGGARWLLLLVPAGVVERVSSQITLIGSAASSAPSLAQALVSDWKIDGAGPIPFPFAFHSGVNPPYIMAYTGVAGSGLLIVLLLLMTSQRWRGWAAPVVSATLLAALAIANEIAFLLVGLGLAVVLSVWLIRRRRMPVPPALLAWVVIFAAALLLGILQGGMLTEMVAAALRHDAAATSYFDPTPSLQWPPAIVSAHLGSLSLLNPAQLLGAVLEIGPVVLVTPLVLGWAWKSVKVGRWFEAGLIASSSGAVLATFLAFKGPLFTAVPRLMTGWFLTSSLYFVPLLWHLTKLRPDSVRIAAWAGGLISCMSGIMLLGVQLAAIQRPMYATFISAMDATMSAEHWNALDRGSLVFDPLVFRAPTVFGRPTRSSPTWYTRSAAWEALRAEPDPRALHRAGFDYVYLDGQFWESLTAVQQTDLRADCVKQVAQVDGTRSETDYTKDFRRLLDIRACE